ncbi:hypothetical protein OTK49_01465 [Vibrio coralliirubri]|uniref:NfeD family protein n=1 Tax=Vibrio coralliirubri TaxID=1516159 RepID=UPI002284A898|nr:hypothetical protein [Vibrio coralliirubri]MCY9861193.1 hypothetical protein [Vibrio coralliirubri]
MDMVLTVGKVMTLVGIMLIICEMMTGASALFLAVLGLIFVIGGVGIELSGMTHYGVITTFIACIAASVFFFLFIWGKSQSKDDSRKLDNNGYEGLTFRVSQPIPAGKTVNDMTAFGINFEVTNQGELDLAEGDEVVVNKESVRRLYIQKV